MDPAIVGLLTPSAPESLLQTGVVSKLKHAREEFKNANQVMIAEVVRVDQNNNLAITDYIQPDECVNTQDLKVKIMNVGFGQVNNYYIGYSINSVPQTPIYVTTALQSEEEYLATFASGYTFTPGYVYDFEVWTYDPNVLPMIILIMT